MPPTQKKSHNINDNSPDHHPHKPGWFRSCFGYSPTQLPVKRGRGSCDDDHITKLGDGEFRRWRKKKRKFWKFSWPTMVGIRVVMKKTSSSTSCSKRRSKEFTAGTKTRRSCLRWVVGGGLSGGGGVDLLQKDVASQQMSYGVPLVVVNEQTSRTGCLFDDDAAQQNNARDIQQQPAAKQMHSHTNCSVVHKLHSLKSKPKPSLRRTAESTARAKMKTDSIFGMSILVVLLILMLSCGRLCAVFCTAIWFYCTPWLIPTNRAAIIDSTQEEK